MIVTAPGFPGSELVIYVARVDESSQITIVDGPYSALTGEAEACEVARELHRRHPEHEFMVLAMAEIEARA